MSKIAEVEKKGWPRFLPLVVVLIAVGIAAYFVEANYRGELRASRTQYFNAQHEETKRALKDVQAGFSSLHRGLRLMALHPEIRLSAGTELATTRNATEYLVELANDTNENSFLCQYYVVSNLGGFGTQVTAIQETHLPWNQRQERVPASFVPAVKSQVAWLREHYPRLLDKPGYLYPALSSRSLIRGLTSIPGTSADPQDAFVLYAVPIYAPNGFLRGAIIASISLKSISKRFNSGNYALIESSMELAVGAGEGTFAEFEELASKGELPQRHIYEEIVPIRFPDALGEWRIWAVSPDSRFADHNEVSAAGQFRFVSMASLVVLALLTLAFFRTSNRHRMNLVAIGKGLEEEVRQRTTELSHVHKMESIGQLAAGVAHEINTPTQYIGDNVRFLDTSFGRINAYVDRVDALLASLESGERCREEFESTLAFRAQARLDRLRTEIPAAIDEALEGIRRVTEIVRAMKEYAHPGAQGLSEVDINKVVESTVTVARNEWKYVAEVELNLEPSIPILQCNAGEIGQVILNLVVNAAHAIRDTKRSEKGLIKVITATSGDKVILKISDNGTGIPERSRAHIFEQFYTTKESGVGTGMGLAIVKRVVEHHGGKIDFSTATGLGTTFEVHLPLRQEIWDVEENAA